MALAEPTIHHAPDPDGLNQDQPWTWSMSDVEGLLSKRQRDYIHTVERLFRIKQANGTVIGYDPEPYQAWYHAHSPLALGPNAPDRIVEKGRGIGATYMTSMDTLLLAHRLDRVNIPVAGQQQEGADELVEKMHDLAQDTTVEGFFDADTDVRSLVRLGNGSTIKPVPGGSPDSIRSKRAPAVVIDEFAFHPNPKRIMRAARPLLSEGGQFTILSTHDGSDTAFYELTNALREDERSGIHFYYPIHDPDTFDQNQSPKTQIQADELALLAPWLDLDTLHDQWREDPQGYAQENLAEVIDEQVNLLSRDVIDAAHVDVLDAWETQPTPDELRDGEEALIDLHPVPSVPERPDEEPHWQNPVPVGVDFARSGDLAAYTALEVTEHGLMQRWLTTLQHTDTPTQNALLRLVYRKLRPSVVAIDMTGNGTGLYDYAKTELPCRVVGINFSSSTDVGDERVSIKKALALNLSQVLREADAHLLGDHDGTRLQKKHLKAVRREDLDARRKKGEGHADIFWALALAAWGARMGPREASTVKQAESHAPRDHQPGEYYGDV